MSDSENVQENLDRLYDRLDQEQAEVEQERGERLLRELARAQATVAKLRRQREEHRKAIDFYQGREDRLRAQITDLKAVESHNDTLVAGVQAINDKLARLRAVVNANVHLPRSYPVTNYTPTTNEYGNGAQYSPQHPHRPDRASFDHGDLRDLNAAWEKLLSDAGLPLDPPNPTEWESGPPWGETTRIPAPVAGA